LWQGLFGHGSMVTSIFGNRTQLKTCCNGKKKKMKRRRTERKTHPRQKGNNKILLSESFIMWLQAINFGASSQMQQQRCQ